MLQTFPLNITPIKKTLIQTHICFIAAQVGDSHRSHYVYNTKTCHAVGSCSPQSPSVSVTVPSQSMPISHLQRIVEDLEDFTGLFGDITIDQFTSCDDAVHMTERAGTEWEADIVASTRAIDDSAADDHSEEERGDEEEVPSQPGS